MDCWEWSVNWLCARTANCLVMTYFGMLNEQPNRTPMQLTVRVARSDSYIGSCLTPGVTPVGACGPPWREGRACRPPHMQVLFAMCLFRKHVKYF